MEEIKEVESGPEGKGRLESSWSRYKPGFRVGSCSGEGRCEISKIYSWRAIGLGTWWEGWSSVLTWLPKHLLPTVVFMYTEKHWVNHADCSWILLLIWTELPTHFRPGLSSLLAVGWGWSQVRWRCEKNPSARRHKRRGFNPWVGKITWRRKWQPTPVFLPGESHGQRSLAGYSPRGHKELDRTEAT